MPTRPGGGAGGGLEGLEVEGAARRPRPSSNQAAGNLSQAAVSCEDAADPN